MRAGKLSIEACGFLSCGLFLFGDASPESVRHLFRTSH